VTKIGGIVLANLTIGSLEVTKEASLVLDPSFTKRRGVFTKVTVVGIPSLLHLFATCEGFAQVTDFVITGPMEKECTPSRNFILLQIFFSSLRFAGLS
jgi:hypothetical protein